MTTPSSSAAPAATRSSSPPYMPQLDGLRCFAVLAVIWAHTGSPAWRPIGLSFAGLYSVWLFFVLSAFLITGILLRVRDAGIGIGGAMRTFYARRLLRIVPSYYGLLIVMAAVLYMTGTPSLKADWVSYVTYLTNWRIVQRETYIAFTTHFWTLAVEEQFYLIWPLLILLVSRRALPRVLVGIALLGVLTRTVIALRGGSIIDITMPTVCNFDTLGFGALLAWHLHTHPGKERERQHAASRAGLVGLALVLLTMGLSVYGHGMRVYAIEEEFGGALIAVWLVQRCARGATGLAKSILEWRPILLIGTLSYSIYLFHFPLIAIIQRTRFGVLPQGPVLFVIDAALSIALASVSWRFYEQPINSLKKRFPYQAPQPKRSLSGSLGGAVGYSPEKHA